MTWYTQVSNDLSVIPDFISYYEEELAKAKKEVGIHGNVEKNIATLPGISENRFCQLQEVEAVLHFLNIKIKQIKKNYFKKYLENYNRELSSRDAEKYAEGEAEVIDFEILINEVALLRNKYLGIMKGLEHKSFMLGHLTKLKVAGMEDFHV